LVKKKRLPVFHRLKNRQAWGEEDETVIKWMSGDFVGNIERNHNDEGEGHEQ
jgi:hypothetical protein